MKIDLYKFFDKPLHKFQLKELTKLIIYLYRQDEKFFLDLSIEFMNQPQTAMHKLESWMARTFETEIVKRYIENNFKKDLLKFVIPIKNVIKDVVDEKLSSENEELFKKFPQSKNLYKLIEDTDKKIKHSSILALMKFLNEDGLKQIASFLSEYKDIDFSIFNERNVNKLLSFTERYIEIIYSKYAVMLNELYYFSIGKMPPVISSLGNLLKEANLNLNSRYPSILLTNIPANTNKLLLKDGFDDFLISNLRNSIAHGKCKFILKESMIEYIFFSDRKIKFLLTPSELVEGINLIMNVSNPTMVTQLFSLRFMELLKRALDSDFTKYKILNNLDELIINPNKIEELHAEIDEIVETEFKDINTFFQKKI